MAVLVREERQAGPAGSEAIRDRDAIRKMTSAP
jgi:hypothetical protein